MTDTRKIERAYAEAGAIPLADYVAKHSGPVVMLKPCPFCGTHLTEPTPVQHPRMALAHMHPGTLDDGTCPIAGWGFYDEQLETWNTRATAEAASAATVAELVAFASGIAEMPEAACIREETAWNLRDEARAILARVKATEQVKP